MKITQLSVQERPRERLWHYGVNALSNTELLALILKSGTKKENVLDLCARLLSNHDLQSLPFCSIQQLIKIHGIGKAKASQILALGELSKRMRLTMNDTAPIQDAKDIAQLYIPKLKDCKKEHLVAIYLDSKHRIICDETITVGILDASLIHPREVFHGALKHLANCVIIVHNHPSGDPTPSQPDLDVTQRLVATGEIMNIPLLDHVIIGRNSWWSYRESLA